MSDFINNKEPENQLLVQNSRISFEEIYMKLAFDLSKRSTCNRLNVGCVIVSADYSHVYGIGYNGNAAGLPNTCDSTEPGNCGCLHAEDNALLKTNGGAEVQKIIFATHQPCIYCAKRIVNKGGVTKVYFSESYRKKEGIEILESAGIEVIQLKISEIIEKRSKKLETNQISLNF